MLKFIDADKQLKDSITEVLDDCYNVDQKQELELSIKPCDTQSKICFDGKRINIEYKNKCDIFYLLGMFLSQNNLHEFEHIRENKEIGAMVDNSRNAVLKVSTIKKLIRKLAVLGYTYLELYTEDTYEVEDNPYFGYLRGRFSSEEIKEIDAYCAKFGIELIPCIQTLAHLNQIFRWRVYSDIHDVNDIMLAGEEKTYELIDKMFLTLSKIFTSKKANIGMDEAHMVGLGKFLDKNGYQNRFEILNKHILRVKQIADKYGFELSIWSDMYFRLAFNGAYFSDQGISKDIVDKVPKGINLIYWDYYSLESQKYSVMVDNHKLFDNKFSFAAGAWNWIGFAPGNKFAIATFEASLKVMREKNVDNCMLTLWGDNGAECSLFATLPALCSFSSMVLNNNNQDNIIKLLSGLTLEQFLSVDFANELGNQKDLDLNYSAKYQLYNDYLVGHLDSLVDDCDEVYSKNIAKLKKVLEAAPVEYKYIFQNQLNLIELLALKYNIGVKTRSLYRQNDKKGLLKLCDVYTEISVKLETFYKSFSAQWYKESKGNGFEVQDLRLGGLMQRTKAVRERILDYCNGKIDKIEELEEDILDYFGNKENYYKDKNFRFNNWVQTASPNNI